MDNQESLKQVLNMRGIVLTEEQQIEFDNTMRSLGIFCNNVVQVVSQIFQEQLKPMLDTIGDIIKQEPKIGIKYGFVKIIKANHYQRINKPRTLNCRSNC